MRVCVCAWLPRHRGTVGAMDEMDGIFASFMNEVSTLKSDKRKKIEEKVVATAEDIVTRMISKAKSASAYELLQISPDATEGEVTKQYRKLSVMIHPDKCQLEGASEAFQILAKAYADTKDASYKDKFGDVIKEARRRVTARREKENKERKKNRQDPLDLQGGEFEEEVVKECEAMRTVTHEHGEYTNKVLEANMKRMEEAAQESKLKRKAADLEKRQWEKKRDKRVAGWQTFVNNCQEKKFKTESWSKVGQVGAADIHHRREGRSDTQTLKAEDKNMPMGIDRTYKTQWR